MKPIQKNQTDPYPLSKLVTVPPKSYASANIEHDSITTIKNYLPSASTLEIIERFAAGLNGAKSGRMLSITGPYGSGKSTMAVFLNGLLSGEKDLEWTTTFKILRARIRCNCKHTCRCKKENRHQPKRNDKMRSDCKTGTR